jgi:uncharacterized protein (TIGR02265 family)
MSDGKIKGTIVIEVVKFLRKYKEQARGIVPAHLQHYLTTRVLATSWHSEKDYLELMRVVVKLRSTMMGGKPGISAFENAARDSSVAYFEGPYKALVRKGDPARTLASLPALWRLRHDTGEFEIELLGEGRARLDLHDYALVEREACELVQGTLWGLLHHSGAKNIELAHAQCRARGNPTCEWQVAWS